MRQERLETEELLTQAIRIWTKSKEVLSSNRHFQEACARNIFYYPKDGFPPITIPTTKGEIGVSIGSYYNSSEDTDEFYLSLYPSLTGRSNDSFMTLEISWSNEPIDISENIKRVQFYFNTGESEVYNYENVVPEFDKVLDSISNTAL